jgi:hypothetical protein
MSLNFVSVIVHEIVHEIGHEIGHEIVPKFVHKIVPKIASEIDHEIVLKIAKTLSYILLPIKFSFFIWMTETTTKLCAYKVALARVT